MNLAADSPMQTSSSSSDDFAAFLDAELEYASSESFESPIQDEKDFPEDRIKRRKVENSVFLEDFQGSRAESVIVKFEEERKCPPHPGSSFKGMCTRCGQQVEVDSSYVPFRYIHEGLKLGPMEIDRLREEDRRNLLRRKKLILILDLDHTLLNTTRLADVLPDEEHVLQEAKSGPDSLNRSLYKLDRMHMLTKLRPFVHEFLEEAKNMFEMYIYTKGDDSYAKEMANILDPSMVYFNSKVISRDHSTQGHRKGLDVILGSESMVIILDDTEPMWEDHKENLILMERYHYFASSCSQFRVNAPSLSQMKKDESQSSGALASILAALKLIHQRFYDPGLKADPSSRDVRQFMRMVRGEVLYGCRIVFSRVFPSNSPAANQPIWKMAEQLGAKCSTVVDAHVTHVVSLDKGTEKARWALLNDKFLVSVHWIEAANFLWRRMKEEDFPVVTPPPAQ